MCVLSNIRHRLERLAASDPDPGRTAAAIALGVFLSFSPFLGLQILIGLGAAVAFRLSRVAVLIGLCANLPWIMLPWYILTTASAAAAMGYTDPLLVEIATDWFSVPLYHASFWNRTGAAASTLFWPFLIGPTIGALLPAGAAYAISYRLLSRHRAHLAAKPEHPLQESLELPRDAQQ